MRIFLPALCMVACCATPAAAAPPDMTQTLHDAVVRCWHPPARATGAVTVHFELGADGSVAGTPTVSGLANAGVAQAAIRAVQFCQPYRLPRERFSDWQHSSVRLTISGP
jgi:hypothetical protein